MILKSKLPQAKKFKRWVTAEVLPAIRKYGGYLTPEKIKEIIANSDTVIELAIQLKQLQEKVTILTHTKKLYTATEIAKELSFRSAIELNKKLEELGIQYKVNGTWVLKADYANLGYEDIKQKKDKFIKLLGENLGNISATCIQTGIARKTYYNWINKDDKFKSKVDEVLEAQIDYVENRLMEKIEAGDLTAIIFYLKTKAKHRGWSEKIELSHNNQAPVINIVGL